MRTNVVIFATVLCLVGMVASAYAEKEGPDQRLASNG